MRSSVGAGGVGEGLSSAVVLQWRDFSLTRTIQLHINAFEYCRQIAGDLRIPEADNAISFPLKPKLPLAIAIGSFVVIVMSAVEFNDQTLGWAEEVDDKGTDRRLPPEVRAIHRELFQGAP
jgi:hypothetical protein